MRVNQHVIDKADLRTTNWVSNESEELAPNAVRLAISAFALTANNVTYAAFGEPPMSYWDFFPSGDETLGRVPVWGFATVEESNVEGIEIGKKYYGYYPISDNFDVTPGKVSERGFLDISPHRSHLSPIYNTYVACDADPSYNPVFEAQQMLFRPLYTTGWMITDCLMQGEPVPQTVVISSASSKTALATAHGAREKGMTCIGLTSAGNAEFVRKSGLYNEVLTYDQISKLKPDQDMAFVDFLGRADVTKQVHETCGSALVRSLVIGVTDWEAERRPQTDLPGPAPELFFVPTYAANRAKSLPAGELERRTSEDLVSFYPVSTAFVTPEFITGADAISKAWLDTVDAKVSPSRGLICAF